MSTDSKPIQILLDFDSPEHLRSWMSLSGYTQDEIDATLDALPEWAQRPAPTEFGLRLWAKSHGVDSVKEIVDTVNKFLRRDIGFKDLKKILDKYK